MSWHLSSSSCVLCTLFPYTLFMPALFRFRMCCLSCCPQSFPHAAPLSQSTFPSPVFWRSSLTSSVGHPFHPQEALSALPGEVRPPPSLSYTDLVTPTACGIISLPYWQQERACLTYHFVFSSQHNRRIFLSKTLTAFPTKTQTLLNGPRHHGHLERANRLAFLFL